MAKVKVISAAEIPCDCMAPPLQCEVSSISELPACSVNGLTYTVNHGNGIVVVYRCTDGEWIPVAREPNPVMAAIQSIGQLNTPLPAVGDWNDISFNVVLKDSTGSMTATNSIILPVTGIWHIGYVVQPQLPQLTVGNMVAQLYFSSISLANGFSRSQVNFDTTNPPVVHYEMNASVVVPVTVPNATIKLQVMPSHANMTVDYRYMWALLVTRLYP